LFCTASTILEDTLKEKILEAINVAVSGKNSFLAILKKNIETVLSEDLDETTADIDKRLEELQTELIQRQIQRKHTIILSMRFTDYVI